MSACDLNCYEQRAEGEYDKGEVGGDDRLKDGLRFGGRENLRIASQSLTVEPLMYQTGPLPFPAEWRQKEQTKAMI